MATTKRLGLAVILAMIAASAGCGDSCVEGTSRCQNNEPFRCRALEGDFGFNSGIQWRGDGPCGASTCIAPANQRAMCVESVDPDPLCAGAAEAYCSGDQVAYCTAGYRVLTAACGSDRPSGGPTATHCVPVGATNATCVPPGSTPEAMCAGGTDPRNAEVRCIGTTQVSCVAGLAVSRTSCADCTPAAFPHCLGFLGDTCTGDSACAPGLTCRPDTTGTSRCTVTCDGIAAPSPSQLCIDLFLDGGPPISDYLILSQPGTVLVCAAGYCEWRQ